MDYSKYFTTFQEFQPPPLLKDITSINRDFIGNHNFSNTFEKETLQDIHFDSESEFDIPEFYKNQQSIQSSHFEQKYFDLLNSSNSKINSPYTSQFRVKSASKKQVLKGSKDFEKAFEEAAKINPEVMQYKNFLTKTADKESDFRSNVQNSRGAPYYGYFQMGVSEIKKTTGLSVEEFRNNPVQQILGAVKLYKSYLKSIKDLGVYNLGKEKGFSDDALVAGAWLGGPGGVRDFLKGIRDPSDSHWYRNKNKGTSVGKRMKLFNV